MNNINKYINKINTNYLNMKQRINYIEKKNNINYIDKININNKIMLLKSEMNNINELMNDISYDIDNLYEKKGIIKKVSINNTSNNNDNKILKNN